MTAVKIKIECEDALLTAVIGSVISQALAAEKFTNVKAKILTVYQETTYEVPGAVSENFAKKSIITGLLNEEFKHQRPPMYLHELIPATEGFLDTVPPSLLQIAISRNAAVRTTPILIDMGFEPPPYERSEMAFLGGEKT